MPKFLIIRFSSIGDIIQCMSVVGGIKDKFPDAQIDWITRSDMAGVLSVDKRINNVWAFNKKEGFKGLLKLCKSLRRERYDYIYDAHLNIRSAVIKSRLAFNIFKFPKIVTRSKDRIKRILLFNFRVNLFDKPFVGVNSYRKPLKRWGITSFGDDKPRDWSFPKEVTDKFAGVINEKTVTLLPSANWAMKRWPVEHWKRLIEIMPEHNFLILAGPKDDFCEDISSADRARVNNLAGKANMLESCYITSISNIVISGDTGFLHSSDMFGVPTVALIGPTAFGYPKWENSSVLEVDLPCRPCTKDGRGVCSQSVYQRCMVDITPEDVVSSIEKCGL